MCEPSTIMMGITLVSGAMTAAGQYQQGKVAQQVGRNNQIMAEYAAQDAQRKGEEDAMEARRRGDAIKGAQRARMAANGLDLGVGTSAELQDQTDFFSEQDQGTARSNAARNAWSLRAGGAMDRAQGDALRSQSNLQAGATLLSTAGQVADRWYSTKKPPGSTGDGLSQGERRARGVY